MNTLLTIALIYFISVIILHIAAYICWSYTDYKGSTLIDMYNYIYKKTGISFIWFWFWVPFGNTMLVIGSMAVAIFFGIVFIISYIMDIIAKGFFSFIGKIGNVKIK